LQALVEGCDQLIIPTTPDALALDALMLTVRALTTLGADRYRVLITMVPQTESGWR
jgi:chromosome partitioning protein